MKLHRDLQPGETLQEGDEFRTICVGGMEWHPVTSEVGATVPDVEEPWTEYRRPVDAVSSDEYDLAVQSTIEALCLLREATSGAAQMNAELADLRQQLADERTEHARTMHGRDTLRTELDQARDQLRLSIEHCTELSGRLNCGPMLQPVTPEAMAEIESRQSAVLIIFQPDKKSPVRITRRFWQMGKHWYGIYANYSTAETRPEKGWFLDLSTIPEEMQ